MNELEKWVPVPQTLDELCAALRAGAVWAGCRRDSDGRLDWTHLPTFGGDEVNDTHGVWSWDADRLLMNSLDSYRLVDIVPRSEVQS